MNPEEIDLSQAERIAFVSTEGDGRPRWTELAIYHLPESFGQRRWLAESKGVSTLPGERTKRRVLHVGSLARSLKLFEDSDIGRIVIEQARDWVDMTARAPDGTLAVVEIKTTSARGVAADPEPDELVAVGPYVMHRDDPLATNNDEELLRWLYGEPDPGHRGFATMFAKDFGLGESSVRMALKNGTGLRVPFRAIATWFDREAFRRDRKGGESSAVIQMSDLAAKAIRLSCPIAKDRKIAHHYWDQAVAIGRIPGEELRGLREYAPALVDFIAEALGVSLSDIMKMSDAGGLSMARVEEALKTVAREIDEQHAKLPRQLQHKGGGNA